jgi:hypothetical protein
MTDEAHAAANAHIVLGLLFQGSTFGLAQATGLPSTMRNMFPVDIGLKRSS